MSTLAAVISAMVASPNCGPGANGKRAALELEPPELDPPELPEPEPAELEAPESSQSPL